MKQLFKNSILFLIPILVLLYPLDCIFSELLKNRNAFAKGGVKTIHQLKNGAIDADILVYGSSRATVHFDIQQLESQFNLKAYNFGVDGHNFDAQYYRHQLFIKNHPLPKHIIVSIDAFTFRHIEKFYNKNQFITDLLWNEEAITFSKNYKGFHFLDYYLPAYRYLGNDEVYREFTNMLAKNKNPEISYKGYIAVDEPWNNDYKKAKRALGELTINIDKRVVTLFETFLNDCIKKGINVTLVYAPEHQLGQDFITNRKAIVSMFKDYAKQYDIPFIDFSNHPINKDKQYFYNTSHLNKKGATLFTKQLIDSLKQRKLIH